jgi:hypothetical protein
MRQSPGAHGFGRALRSAAPPRVDRDVLVEVWPADARAAAGQAPVETLPVGGAPQARKPLERRRNLAAAATGSSRYVAALDVNVRRFAGVLAIEEESEPA